MLADDWNGLSRSDVVARLPVVFEGSVEVLFDDLLTARESVSTAHGIIMARACMMKTASCQIFPLVR